ncbi:endolysin [Serratia phage Parlo]|uniref:Endolysin n=1 Tax=Serratia phage Parlo TaxID=2557554 RepID=A0A482MGB9_9CAUD|nr:endolysin [Serratia phage Parlo]QBQ72232.1 endolysin [Serratia phage Parlo]
MPLSPKDFQIAADALGVPVPAVKAVAEVEANGMGFLPDGRPKILFERHIFRKRLIAKGIDVAKVPTGICSEKPGGYLGGSDEHTRLDQAAKFDRDAALESASWGAFQIMGYHWKTLGYPSLQAFINAMYKDDAGQLDAFIRFIKADPRLVKAMKTSDWATFARIYNGPDYAKNNYDSRLAAANKRAGGK